MILLARHGHHEHVGSILGGRSEISLDDIGRGEAARLAAHLAAERHLEAVHSSPRKRALETARAVAEAHDLPVVAADDLDEIDFGEWTGCRFADLDGRAAWRRWNAERGTAATPAGDTMGAVTARALRHVEALPPEKDVLCVTHGDVIRGLVVHCLGWPVDRLFSFNIDLGSVTTIDMTGATPRVVALNERPA